MNPLPITAHQEILTFLQEFNKKWSNPTITRKMQDSLELFDDAEEDDEELDEAE